MEFFPFFRRPYYYPQNNYMNMPYGIHREKTKDKNEQMENNYEFKEKQKVQNRYDEPRGKKQIDSSCKNEKPIFEIFGLELYFDDILIIALIFFLYNEGVRDNLLFISLVLLLLS